MLLVCLFICLSAMDAIAQQRNCGTMDYLDQQLLQDPKRADKMQQIEAFTQKFAANKSLVNGVVTIPVVVHVVYRSSSQNVSDAQVQSQIDVLNKDFRRLNSDADNVWPQASDADIEFCLASIDPNGNTTNGITRTATNVRSFGTNDKVKFSSQGGHDAWPATDYLNIWVCYIGGGILGYAQFPGGSASTDGVVIDYGYFGTIGTATYPYDLGRTATHEVGHWLNLRHIWGDGGCSVDDYVNDTPVSDGANYGCAIGHVSCGTVDMVQNYMDYSDDACMNLFTAGQKTRMQALFAPGGYRYSIVNSTKCGGTPPPAATCDDGIQNGDETGVDCGGSSCAPCTCNGTFVTLSITFDNYPEETSWSLMGDNTGLAGSGGTYPTAPDGSTLTVDMCLPDDCYTFTIFDAYGDGICCSYGSGSYSLTDADGNVLASGGSFASSEATSFCVPAVAPPPPPPPPAATCDDGIQNGNETGVDCGGPDCPSCPCTPQLYDFSNFEGGSALWRDGGKDCIRKRNTTYAYSGRYSYLLRDNTSSSVLYTNDQDFSGYSSLTVEFTYVCHSMDNANEDFFLEVSTDGGSSWTMVEEWNYGDEFVNETRYFENVTVNGPFTANTRLRFRCDASADDDQVYIDDVTTTLGCPSGARTDNHVAPVIEKNTAMVSNVSVFPNPTQNRLTVSFDAGDAGPVQLWITDITGKLWKQQVLATEAGTYSVELDLGDVPAGMYLLRLQQADQVHTEKVLIIE